MRGALAVLWLACMCGLSFYTYIQYSQGDGVWLTGTLIYLCSSIAGMFFLCVIIYEWHQRGRLKRGASGSSTELDCPV